MRSIAFVLMIAACGGPAARPVQAEPEPDLVGEMLGRIALQRDLVCACEDRACVEQREAEVMEWMKENVARFEDAKPTPAQKAEAERLGAEIAACKQRHGA